MNEIDYQWTTEPQAARLIQDQVQACIDKLPWLRQLSERMLAETGTRLIDWVDHICISESDQLAAELNTAGFVSTEIEGSRSWQHPRGIFPSVVVDPAAGESSIVLNVESVADFLHSHQRSLDIQGAPLSPLRMARVEHSAGYALWVIERHGRRGFKPVSVSADQIVSAVHHAEAFSLRRRRFDTAEAGFLHTRELVAESVSDIGVDWTCDLFFAAERRYWQSRNRAAQVQRRRQDRLGLGWANHDHHTYRSSRGHFKALIELLQQMGFECRERFYGGADAGWGAQVLEQSATGIVIFADVDMTPEEVMGDFAQQGLAPRADVGTVGLWCALHGEAILEAGMHHLECQFDFAAARKQLAEAGIESMPPFTDMPQLKQSFTQGEIWSVQPDRLEAALKSGAITAEQVERFSQQGSIGSHLEILERNDGYKGFNQTGISQIIRQTDPRTT